MFFVVHGLSTVLYMDWNGEITAVKTECEQPLNNRCIQIYVLKLPNGQQKDVSIYGSIFDDRDLVIGNVIHKSQFSFSYEVNGKKKEWTYKFFYFKWLAASLLLGALWLWQPLRRKLAVIFH